MAEVITFPAVARQPASRGYLHVWQDRDGSWNIDHVSRWGDSAGLVRCAIPTQHDAFRQARILADAHGYSFDEVATVGGRP